MPCKRPDDRLNYLNNRHLDPTTGTFLSVDPLVAMTGYPYLYGNGNPVTLSDPTGLYATGDDPDDPEHNRTRPGLRHQPRRSVVQLSDYYSLPTVDDYRRTAANVAKQPVTFMPCGGAGFGDGWGDDASLGAPISCTLDALPGGESDVCLSGSAGLALDGFGGSASTTSAAGGNCMSSAMAAASGGGGGKKGNKKSRQKSAVDPETREVPQNALSDLEGSPKPSGKTRTNAQSGSQREYYEWDYTHGNIEVYDKRGHHKGSMDPFTGEMTKPAVPGRKIDV